MTNGMRGVIGLYNPKKVFAMTKKPRQKSAGEGGFAGSRGGSENRDFLSVVGFSTLFRLDRFGLPNLDPADHFFAMAKKEALRSS